MVSEILSKSAIVLAVIHFNTLVMIQKGTYKLSEMRHYLLSYLKEKSPIHFLFNAQYVARVAS